MRNETNIRAIANENCLLVLPNEEGGGFYWVADHGTLEDFAKNYIDRSSSNQFGIGGETTYIFNFPSYPPLHRIEFVKKRNWDDAVCERHIFNITIYPESEFYDFTN